MAKLALTQDEIDESRGAFTTFDKDRSGTIDIWELRQVLEGTSTLRPRTPVSRSPDLTASLPPPLLVVAVMGQPPTEEELFQMISEVDDDMSGSIDFTEFLKVIENQKLRASSHGDESDTLDAFVACGGAADKSGHVSRETLIKIIKHDFGLTIDIEKLIDDIDEDGSGEIEFKEFSTLMTSRR